MFDKFFKVESNNSTLNETAETFIIGDIFILLIVGVPPAVAPVLFDRILPAFNKETALVSIYFISATGWAGILWWRKLKIYVAGIIPWWGFCAFTAVVGIIMWLMGYPEKDFRI
jgi:predicted MFS family arabinose efflux permease